MKITVLFWTFSHFLIYFPAQLFRFFAPLLPLLFFYPFDLFASEFHSPCSRLSRQACAPLFVAKQLNPWKKAAG